MEKYTQVPCIKCKIPTIFDGGNDVKVNGKQIGVLCWKCERSIFGGEDK